MMSFQLWVAPLLLLPLLFLLVSRRKSNKKLPPGPRGLPIIGNLHQVGILPHRTLWQLSKKHGPVLHINLGQIPTVVVMSAETAKEILNIHDLKCCTRPSMKVLRKLFYNHSDVAFAPYGQYWKEMRKLCVQELFSAQRVQSFRYIREEELALLLDSIANSAFSGSPVDLSEKLVDVSAEITSRLAFGRSCRGSKVDNDRFGHIASEAAAVIGSVSVSDYFPLFGEVVDWLTGFDQRLKMSFRDLDAFYEQIIEEHLKKGESNKGKEDIVDVLLKLERDCVLVGNHPLTRVHIKAILMDVFAGATDTITVTMVWVMTELAREPRVMKKVQSEIRNLVRDKDSVTEDDLYKLEYLKMVIKETWRLHPPVPLLAPREAMSEFEVKGYNIYPKTRIFVNAWAIGRDPRTWEDPEKFIPERFIDNPIEIKGSNYELLPFGGGRRSCPGQYMAMTSVEITLAKLLFHFDWKLPDGMKQEDISLQEAPGMSVGKKFPLKLVPIKYRPN